MIDTPEEQALLWSALCQSQRLELVGETTGGMIHELNNGLSVVNGLVELLVEKLNDSPDTQNLSTAGSEDLLDMARQDLAKVVVWMDSSMASAERLLAYAHRMTGRAGAELDVNELCAAALDESRYRCEREGIDMKLDLADGLPRVHGHAGQLLCALANVVRNSREAYGRDAAATDSRTIRLSTHMDGANVVTHIDDEGPGIPQDLSERVFELAFSTKKDADAAGMGSGLPVARKMVRGHGGDLRLGERATGTRIVIELPGVKD